MRPQSCPSARVTAAPAVPTPAVASNYTVAPGDNLFSIAERLLGDGNAYPELAAANHILNPSVIHPGQVLVLPT